MAVTVVATPGAANANSYLTLAEAVTYFESRLPVTAWEEATTDTKNRLIVMATRVMDSMARPLVTYYPASGGIAAYYKTSSQWTGSPATTTQRLAWPRIGMYDANGNAIAETDIPGDLKDATAELAGALGTSDSTLDNDVIIQGITSIKAGSVALTFKDMIEKHIIPDFVYSMMPASWFTDEIIVMQQTALFDVVSE